MTAESGPREQFRVGAAGQQRDSDRNCVHSSGWRRWDGSEEGLQTGTGSPRGRRRPARAGGGGPRLSSHVGQGSSTVAAIARPVSRYSWGVPPNWRIGAPLPAVGVDQHVGR